MSEHTALGRALETAVSSLDGGGERRPGQQEMCEAVGEAMESGRHLVVAAGTGTGKSLAYLVPLVMGEGPSVVATATKTLQDQLVDKDLPQLVEALGLPVRYAVLKGRSNYLWRPAAGRAPRGQPAEPGHHRGPPSGDRPAGPVGPPD